YSFLYGWFATAPTWGKLNPARRSLCLPAFHRNIDPVPFRIVDAVFRVRDAVRPLRAAPDAGAFGAVADLFDVLDVKAEVVVAVLFLADALIEQRDVEVAVGDENRGTVRIGDFLHSQGVLIKIRQPLGIGSIERDVFYRERTLLRRRAEPFVVEIDEIAVRVGYTFLAIRRGAFFVARRFRRDAVDVLDAEAAGIETVFPLAAVFEQPERENAVGEPDQAVVFRDGFHFEDAPIKIGQTARLLRLDRQTAELGHSQPPLS